MVRKLSEDGEVRLLQWWDPSFSGREPVGVLYVILWLDPGPLFLKKSKSCDEQSWQTMV